MAKPTYEELRQALQAVTVDAYETYKALEKDTALYTLQRTHKVLCREGVR